MTGRVDTFSLDDLTPTTADTSVVVWWTVRSPRKRVYGPVCVRVPEGSVLFETSVAQTNICSVFHETRREGGSDASP